MNFIKKIFEKKVDELVHHQFIRFGIGDYERALITLTKGKDLKIKTSYDLANDIFAIIAENIKENADVSGEIISNKDFEKELEIEIKNYSKRGNLYTAELKTTLKPEQLKEIYQKFKFDFLLLSVNSKNFKLSTSKSLPKPGGKIKDNFCSAILPLSLLDEFAFDIKQDFKQLKITHKYIITEIIIPDNVKNDFTLARLKAKRKGKLIRTLEIDGKQLIKEIELNV